MPNPVKKNLLHLFYRSKLHTLGNLGDIDDFFLVSYHNLLSHWAQGLVSGVLINHKVREREQFKLLTRWGGQHSRNESTSSRRWVAGKGTSRTRSLVASYRWPSVTAHLLSFPNAAGECCATNTKGRSLFHSCQNAKSRTTNFWNLWEEDLQSWRPRVHP